jgi:hypothetical protein
LTEFLQRRGTLLRLALAIVVLAFADWIGRRFWSAGIWSVFASSPYFWCSVLLGVLTGAAEVIARYRDEPFAAILSPPGLSYLAMNGAVSGAAYGLLSRYKDKVLPGVGDDLMRSMVAGFGAMVVMRSKLFNFRTEKGEEYAVGPDAVVSTFLASVDRKIDRGRSLRRQQIVFEKTALITDPARAPAFLRTSLASYQNLSGAEKIDLNAAIGAIVADPLLEPRLKLVAISFGLLNVCGEANFSDVMESLRKYQMPPK